MRKLAAATLVVFLSPLAALAEDKPWELDALLARMSEGGKRRFIYEEVVSLTFRDQKVRLVNSAEESGPFYPLGVELLKTAGLAVVALEAGQTPTYRVIPTSVVRLEALRTYESVQDLPVANEYCSLRLKLNHARGRDVLNVVQALLADPRNVTLAEGLDEVLILSGYAQTLRVAGQTVAAIDVAPAEGASWRLTVAALEAEDGGDGTCPEAFKKAGLPEAVGRKTFRLLTDGCTTVVTGGKTTAARVSLGLGAIGTLDVSLNASADGAAAPEASIDVRGRDAVVAGMQLAARTVTKEDGWVVMGTLSEKDTEGKVIVLLVKAERAK